MTREEAIKTLKEHKIMFQHDFGWDISTIKALEMAIASLKTDEAYQLEYENRDFVEIPEGMTNGEVIQALFPEVKVEIDGFLVRCMFIEHEFTTTEEWWNAPYQKGGEE